MEKCYEIPTYVVYWALNSLWQLTTIHWQLLYLLNRRWILTSYWICIEYVEGAGVGMSDNNFTMEQHNGFFVHHEHQIHKKHTCHLQQPVSQSAFSMVYMSNNAEVPDFVWRKLGEVNGVLKNKGKICVKVQRQTDTVYLITQYSITKNT